MNLKYIQQGNNLTKNLIRVIEMRKIKKWCNLRKYDAIPHLWIFSFLTFHVRTYGITHRKLHNSVFFLEFNIQGFHKIHFFLQFFFFFFFRCSRQFICVWFYVCIAVFIVILWPIVITYVNVSVWKWLSKMIWVT